LFELLRRLRQRVELSGMEPRRHEEVARAFGRRRSQDRGLEFEEALLLHAAAKRVDDRTALHDVLVDAVAAQIEEAVFQPQLFRIFGLAEYRHRQFAGGTQHFYLGRKQLDFAGRQILVVGAVGALAQLAVDTDHPFGAQRLGNLERGAVGIGHDLRDPVVIAQIDEQEPAVVADAMAPAREPDSLADLRGAERAAVMGPITMHGAGIRL
jgi:hypothetical protein